MKMKSSAISLIHVTRECTCKMYEERKKEEEGEEERSWW